jgi:hypothetical protein
MKDIEEEKNSERTLTFSFNEYELHQIRYALTELSFKRAEQSLDFGNPELTKEAQFLRELANRLFAV